MEGRNDSIAKGWLDHHRAVPRQAGVEVRCRCVGLPLFLPAVLDTGLLGRLRDHVEPALRGVPCGGALHGDTCKPGSSL